MNKVKTKDKILLTIISLFLFLSIVVIFIPLISQSRNNRYFRITSNEQVINNVISINDLSLEPGNSKRSKIELECISTNKYKLTLLFQEKETGMLKDYLDVEVYYNNDLIHKDNLNTMFNSDGVSIIDDFYSGSNYEIKIIYILPNDIGNEAQGAKTKFDIEILIEQE